MGHRFRAAAMRSAGLNMGGHRDSLAGLIAATFFMIAAGIGIELVKPGFYGNLIERSKAGVIMSRTGASEETAREMIQMGCVQDYRDLQREIREFNKTGNPRPLQQVRARIDRVYGKNSSIGEQIVRDIQTAQECSYEEARKIAYRKTDELSVSDKKGREANGLDY